MSIPELSPFIAANRICHDCGSVMKPKPVMGRRGQKTVVDHLEYVCKNPKTGCNYKINSFMMGNEEMVALREDGSEVRIGE